jgi:hypothetical protein
MAMLSGDQQRAREMGEHRVALIGLVQRFAMTGKAAFSEREYEQARQCARTMRTIAEETSLSVAIQASEIGVADLEAIEATI